MEKVIELRTRPHRKPSVAVATERQAIREIPMRTPGWKTVVYNTGELVLVGPDKRPVAYYDPYG